MPCGKHILSFQIYGDFAGYSLMAIGIISIFHWEEVVVQKSGNIGISWSLSLSVESSMEPTGHLLYGGLFMEHCRFWRNFSDLTQRENTAIGAIKM